MDKPPSMDEPPISIVAMHQRNYWSCVALTTLMWDWAVSLEDEIQYIWKSPSMTNKWVYLISRYLGIISQLVDSAIILSNGCNPVPKEICRTWMSFETAISVILFGLIEFIQCLRVYAFYNKNAKLGIFLVIWFCAGIGGAVYYLWYGFSSSHMDFDPSCAVIHMPLISMVFGVIPVANQAMALFLLFWRRKVVAPGYLGDVPIAYIVLRDGILLFLATCGIIAMAMAYVTKKAHPIYMTPVLNATLSIAACRMILNLQSMTRQTQSSSRPDEYNLTSLPLSAGVLPIIDVTVPANSSCPSRFLRPRTLNKVEIP